jgi:hypothetical protein
MEKVVIKQNGTDYFSSMVLGFGAGILGHS